MTHFLYFRFPITALIVALTVSGCSTLDGLTKKKDEVGPLVCPRVAIDRVTSSLTRFRDGPGRDITDVDTEAEILGYSGDCGRSKKGVDMTMTVSFSANRGPAAKGRQVEIPYFIAVSRLPPPIMEEKESSETGEKIMVRKRGPEADAPKEREILSKQVFQIVSAFPEGINTIHVQDEEIVLELPLTTSEQGRNFTVHLGLQLTRDELEHNLRQQH